MAQPDSLGADRPAAPSAPTHDPATADEVRAQVARVLASPGFYHAPRRQRFLSFVVEETLAGRGDALKEFVVAAEVFDRRDTYDPAVDAVVRVEARRVREKLNAYYASAGRADPLRIVLPVGTYLPSWHRQDSAAPAIPAVVPLGPVGEDTPAAEASGPAPAARARRWPWLIAGVFLLFAVVASAWVLWGTRSERAATATIAVLPMTPLDEDADTAYLATGLSEDLTSELSRVGRVTVIGRRSAATLRAKGMDALDIGRELAVSAVLDGAVRRHDGRVRITVRLLDTATGRQTWAETYDRPWLDILGLQRDVADSVADALAGRLGPRADSAADPRHQTSNSEAWSAYLKGRYLRGQRSQAGILDSIGSFERAVTLDPDYAEAWAALGEALTTTAFHGFRPKPEAVPRAREALDRALTLAPGLADAHAARGWLAFVHDWNWPVAEREFRQALKIDPGLAQARQMYAFGLASRRRFDEALAQSQEAMALDPHAYAASPDLSVLLLFARRYGDALTRARDTLRLDPSSSIAHVVAGSALVLSGDVDAGIHELERGTDSATFSTVLGRLGYAYAVSGRRGDSLATLQRIDTTFGDRVSSPVERAFVYTGLGDRTTALAELARAVDQRDGEVMFLDVLPFFDTLREEPAFQELRTRVGLGRS